MINKLIRAEYEDESYLLELYLLVVHTLFKLLVCCGHHLEALLVAILDRLHLNAKAFYGLVQIFDH